MQKWVLIRKSGNFTDIAKRQGISPIMARLLINRDVKEEDIHTFLEGEIKDMHSPYLLKDMEKGAEIILRALADRKRIRVIGDYDIDGICSSYILQHALENCFEDINGSLSNGCIDTVLPHRIDDGYGMNVNLIDKAIEEGVELIITCDNGISALEEVKYGNAKGIEFIITDHHELPYHEENGAKVYDMPEALAVINPKRPDNDYPFKDICAGLVAYKLAQVLYEKCNKGREVQEFLDFAAFATVGDIMPLCDENRILVQHGLKAIKNTKNLGLKTLMKVCDLENSDYISAYHIGFVLGPCMNASGRIDDAQVTRKLLDCTDEQEAVKLALMLKAYNDERKKLTQEGTNQAITNIQSLEKLPDVLVVYLPECHESIAGIIAGRLKETYFHPAIVLTKTETGVKGSGRSIEEYDLHENLMECKELFSKFGGHKMAAGLSMEAASEEERLACVQRLSKALNDKSQLLEDNFLEKVKIDMELPFSYVDMKLCEEIKKLEPCGLNNRRPIFVTQNVTLSEGRIIGKNKNVYKARAKDSMGQVMDVVMFGGNNINPADYEGRNDVKIVYSPDINEYNGRSSVQLVLKGIK